MITPGSVKICGLRNPVHAEYVVSTGADFFGLNFVNSAWRYVTPEIGRAFVSEVRSLAASLPIKAVGVFAESTVDQINRVAEIAALDYIQIHVPELPANWNRIERPVIPVLRPVPGTSAEHVRHRIAVLKGESDNVAAILIDTHSPDALGGTGEVGDWTLAREVASTDRIILAGGLTPGNVAEAIRTVLPIAVDVSSGVETDREKDPAKIRSFVGNARRAFSDLLIRQMDDFPIS